MCRERHDGSKFKYVYIPCGYVWLKLKWSTVQGPRRKVQGLRFREVVRRLKARKPGSWKAWFLMLIA